MYQVISYEKIGINLIHLYDNKFDEDVHSKLDQGGDLVSYMKLMYIYVHHCRRMETWRKSVI
jgi:hypothetical protein